MGCRELIAPGQAASLPPARSSVWYNLRRPFFTPLLSKRIVEAQSVRHLFPCEVGRWWA
jgi:hypothetical protein